MKFFKFKLISLCTVLSITILSVILSGNSPKENTLKLESIKKFYSSYEKKDINIYNDSVIDELQIKNTDDKNLISSIYQNIVNFKILNIEELKNSNLIFNEKTYDKDNIAKFEISYEVKFKENITSSEEGKVSTVKIITREDKDSPWLVAGQEGHGL